MLAVRTTLVVVLSIGLGLASASVFLCNPAQQGGSPASGGPNRAVGGSPTPDLATEWQLARGSMSQCRVRTLLCRMMEVEERQNLRREIAEYLLELDPKDPIAHVALGHTEIVERPHLSRGQSYVFKRVVRRGIAKRWVTQAELSKIQESEQALMSFDHQIASNPEVAAFDEACLALESNPALRGLSARVLWSPPFLVLGLRSSAVARVEGGSVSFDGRGRGSASDADRPLMQVAKVARGCYAEALYWARTAQAGSANKGISLRQTPIVIAVWEKVSDLRRYSEEGRDIVDSRAGAVHTLAASIGDATFVFRVAQEVGRRIVDQHLIRRSSLIPARHSSFFVNEGLSAVWAAAVVERFGGEVGSSAFQAELGEQLRSIIPKADGSTVSPVAEVPYTKLLSVSTVEDFHAELLAKMSESSAALLVRVAKSECWKLAAYLCRTPPGARALAQFMDLSVIAPDSASEVALFESTILRNYGGDWDGLRADVERYVSDLTNLRSRTLVPDEAYDETRSYFLDLEF